MIEVEKRFKPTEGQLAKMLAGSEFLEKKVLHDIYYDFEDNRLFRGYVKFRSRNGQFEIKIEDRDLENKNIKAEVEIEDEEEIKKYFNTNKTLQEFVSTEMKVFSDYKNERSKYKNGEFNIDVDKLDFGYEMVEIELMVENKDHIEEAEKKILDFVKKYDFEIKDVHSKGKKYFEIVKPELYEKLFLNR